MDAATATEPRVVAGGTTGEPPVPWVNVTSRHVMNMALLVMLPMVAASTLNYALTLMIDPDIWWHLANARILVTQHHFIHTDPYSFTAVGQRWIDWEWLSEIPYWFSYQTFGLRGIYLITWLSFGANLLFVYWRGYRLGRSADGALWATAIAFLLMTVNAGPRMIQFAYLAMSAELAILEAADRGNKRLFWLLPPLFCLWINLHGTWLVGLGLLGLYIVCGWFPLRVGVFQQTAFSRSERNQLVAVFCASAIACVLNPYGWHLMWQPFDMMLKQTVSVATIAEWQPLSLSSMEGRGVLVAIVAMVLANCVRGRTWKVHELAMIFFAWYMAIDSSPLHLPCRCSYDTDVGSRPGAQLHFEREGRRYDSMDERRDDRGRSRRDALHVSVAGGTPKDGQHDVSGARPSLRWTRRGEPSTTIMLAA